MPAALAHVKQEPAPAPQLAPGVYATAAEAAAAAAAAAAAGVAALPAPRPQKAPLSAAAEQQLVAFFSLQDTLSKEEARMLAQRVRIWICTQRFDTVGAAAYGGPEAIA